MAVDFISRFGVSVTLKRRNTEPDADAEYEGNASVYQDAESILAVYDPVYSDLGRDSPERRTGTVLTYEAVSLGDLIEDQEITQVIPRFNKDGSFYYNRVSL